MDLLSSLPAEFTGDVLLIRDDGSGQLSSTARCGDRVVYSLMSDDVRFYLEGCYFVSGRMALGGAA